MTGSIDIIAAADSMDKTEVRRRGIGFIDGSYAGYVILIGNDIKAEMLKDLTSRKIIVFITSESLQSRLKASGYDLDWESGLVAFDLPQALGFLYSVTQVFGDADDHESTLDYARQKLRGFTLLLDEPTPEYLSGAQSALTLGCPLLTTAQLLSSVENWEIEAEYRPVIGNLPLADIVQLGIEERGLQISFPIPELPIAYSSDFMGQVVRDDACRVCFTGVELTRTGEDIVDGQVKVIGPDLDSGMRGDQSYGLLIEVSGRDMQTDFESVLEREIETIFNDLDGVVHRGQRTIASLRITQKAIDKGLRLQHLGKIVHARYHNDFGNILSRVQVTIYTQPEDIKDLAEKAQAVYQQRDQRLLNTTDESVDTFYTCTTCQSISGDHVCVISPEHPGICGAVDWMDARAGTNIRPVGPNKAVQKNDLIDANLGQWGSVNQIVQQESGGALAAYSLYSLMQDPSTAVGDFDCITAMLPLSNGVMVVGRNYKGMTPSGMDWDMLFEVAGSGTPVPGFIGHSKRAMHREKFISAEGGWRRIVWMDHSLREELRPVLDEFSNAAGIPGFVDMIATEENALSEEKIMAHMEACGHPALVMDPMI
jgi:acetyl-CoA synthase